MFLILLSRKFRGKFKYEWLKMNYLKNEESIGSFYCSQVCSLFFYVTNFVKKTHTVTTELIIGLHCVTIK